MQRSRLIALFALPLVVAGGCTKKNPEPDASATDEEKSGAEAAAAGKEETKENGPTAAKPTGLGTEAAAMIQTATAAAAAAPLLEHDGILGHVMMGDAVASVKEIRQQIAPASKENLVDLEALKSLTAMQLGERSTVAVNVDLNKPFGCALVDSKVIEAPVACTVGYKGGAEGLIKDMGETGKLPDAKGHLAAYDIEGQTVYVDAIGDQVGLCNHPEVFDKAKGYLETNIIGRADETIADFELMVYPNAAMARYEDELTELGSLFEELSTPTASGTTPADAADLKQRIMEMDQLALGFGLTIKGAHFSVATHAVPGSKLAKEIDSTYAGRMNADFVSKLPMSTFVFAGLQLGTGILESDNWKKGMELVYAPLSKEFGMDADEMRAEVEAFVKEESELYTRDIAMGVVYEPGTLGAVVFEVGKKAPGRDKWKTWSERFTVDAVLPKEAHGEVKWTFTPGATTVEGVDVDRWAIGLTSKALSEAGSDPDLERVLKMWPDLTLKIDRAEVDDRVIFVVAPTEIDTYMQSAIKATRGGKTVKDRKGWDNLDAARTDIIGIYAMDIAGGVEWLRPLLSASDAADIPSPLGAGLDDVTFVSRHPAPGVATGSFNVSQAFIDQIRKHADR